MGIRLALLTLLVVFLSACENRNNVVEPLPSVVAPVSSVTVPITSTATLDQVITPTIQTQESETNVSMWHGCLTYKRDGSNAIPDTDSPINPGRYTHSVVLQNSTSATLEGGKVVVLFGTATGVDIPPVPPNSEVEVAMEIEVREGENQAIVIFAIEGPGGFRCENIPFWAEQGNRFSRDHQPPTYVWENKNPDFCVHVVSITPNQGSTIPKGQEFVSQVQLQNCGTRDLTAMQLRPYYGNTARNSSSVAIPELRSMEATIIDVEIDIPASWTHNYILNVWQVWAQVNSKEVAIGAPVWMYMKIQR